MSEFGPCSVCGEPSVVKVNSTAACAAHLDEVLGAAFAPVRDAVRRASQ